MIVSELIAELQKLPPDLKVWVSEGGYVEGAMPLTKIEVEDAWSAGLDGDEVDDEYHFVGDVGDSREDLKAKGYKLVDGNQVWTKKIVVIKTKLD